MPKIMPRFYFLFSFSLCISARLLKRAAVTELVLFCLMCHCDTFCYIQGAAAYPENEDQQQKLREAAEGLRVATNAAAQNAIKKKLVTKLEVSVWLCNRILN